jgi:cytochrome c
MYKTVFFAAAAAALMFATPAMAEGDAAKGEKVFLKCKACHENEKGRKAASVEGYKYSEAMIAKGAEGIMWDEATLAVYLPDPKAFVPKTKMAFAGLKKPEEVADIIAYLKAHP